MSRSRHFGVLLAATIAIAPANTFAAPQQTAKPAEKPAAAAPASKVKLTYKAQAGQFKRAKSTVSFVVDLPGGQKGNLESKETGKSTFTAVDASGNITIESKTEASETSFNGQKQPADDDNDTSTLTITPLGTIVSYKPSKSAAADTEKLGIRIGIAGSIVFPDKEIGVGDKWSYEYKSDAAIGSRNAKADFEVLAFETLGGIECVKIKHTYTESGESPNITTTATTWVEKNSGDTVKQEAKIEGIPFGPPESKAIGAGTVVEERIEGGPLPGSKGTGATSDVKKDKTIDETVKDFEKLPGVVTLYKKSEAGKQTIYAELREDQLNKLMMLEMTASTGTSDSVVAGDPLYDMVLKFERTPDERIFLTVPNFNHRVDSKKPLAKSLKRSYSDSPLVAFKIEAKQADRKSILIDVTDLFRGDLSGISATMGAGGGFSSDREKTYVQSVKNFPDNLFIQTHYTFSKGLRSPFDIYNVGTTGDARAAVVMVNYNLFPLPVDENGLPNNGYVPRLADARVGYFENIFQNYDVDGKADPITRYILRWDLRKKDPSAAMSEPLKPIVFWLDNAIPLEYRQATKEGILMWNKAFEKIGFKNAVQVQQMPDNADFDHADMRYNVIRWVSSPNAGYAVALFRSNPLTGQIMNANITVDSNFTRYIILERRESVNPAAAFDSIINEDVLALAKRKADAERGQTPNGIANKSNRYCDYGSMKLSEGWFGYHAMDAVSAAGITPIDDKTYLNDYLREVVCHEMGHIMGLRHNFVASTLHTPAELKNPALMNSEGITASVMDYGPFNIYALRQKGVPFYSRTVGLYDTWAIQYGYTPIAGTTPQAQKPALNKIAAHDTDRGHAYLGDEYADTFDPRVTRFDLSAEPLDYNAKSLEVTRYILLNLGERVPKKGESYYEFTRQFRAYLNRYARAASQSVRYVGGLNQSKNFRGDKGEMPVLAPIPADKQRRALSLVNTYVFSPSALAFPKNYYTKLAEDPYDGGASEAPIKDIIGNIQTGALRSLFASGTLRRVSNNEYKVGDKSALTMPYLFNSVALNVWSELKGGTSVPTLRRNLQRTHIDLLSDMATKSTGAPEDAKMIAWDQLRQLGTAIQMASAKPGLDEYTQIHYRDSLGKIKRTLNAQVSLGESGGGGGLSLLQLLLGGSTEGRKP